jgi:hypothetical protein
MKAETHPGADSERRPATKYTSAQIVDVQRAPAARTTDEHPSGAVDGRPENRAAFFFGQQILYPDRESASTKPLLHLYPLLFIKFYSLLIYMNT